MLFDNAIANLSIVVWVIVVLMLAGSLVLTARQYGIFAAIRRVFSLHTILYFIVPAIAITVLSNSLVFIAPQQVGVVISLIQPDGYRDQPIRSGLHWIAPLLEQSFVYTLSKQTYAMTSKPSEESKQNNNGVSARTSDGQEVTIFAARYCVFARICQFDRAQAGCIARDRAARESGHPGA